MCVRLCACLTRRSACLCQPVLVCEVQQGCVGKGVCQCEGTAKRQRSKCPKCKVHTFLTLFSHFQVSHHHTLTSLIDRQGVSWSCLATFTSKGSLTDGLFGCNVCVCTYERLDSGWKW